MKPWTEASIPDLFGRTAVVTGASSGLGAAAADALAAKGATLVMAVRDVEKGEQVRDAIRRRHPAADVQILRVDLADLSSVREAADRAVRMLPQIDILINNAGLGMQRRRATTTDGFERQFGTNHLGQFALTGLLLPALLKAPAARIVAISSLAHRSGTIAFDDLQGEHRYGGLTAYGQSKLANLLFTFELARRVEGTGARIVALAAHPGIASTGFVPAMALPRPVTAAMTIGAKVFAQSAARGALPGLYAATMPGVKPGDYYGPNGPGELRGTPAPAAMSPRAKDTVSAERLWHVSEALTGVAYRQLEPRFRSV